MKPPERIWLQVCKKTFDPLTTWCEDKINPGDIEYRRHYPDGIDQLIAFGLYLEMREKP